MRGNLLFYAISTTCVFAQNIVNNVNRFVDPTIAKDKSDVCRNTLGFDYYIVTQNGQQVIDREYYLRRWHGYWKPRPCPPRVLFTLNSGCICDTRVPDTDLLNTERCVIISGNAQYDNEFVLKQPGSADRLIYVSSLGDLLTTTDSCKGSSSTAFRQVDFFTGNALATTQLDIAVTFSIPQIPEPVPGKAYRIAGTTSCGQDIGGSSFYIRYVVAPANLSPTIAVVFRFKRTANVNAEEIDGSITCTIPAGINHPTNPFRSYNWDASDPGNMVRVTVDLNNLIATRIGLYNSVMVANGIDNPNQVPPQGFCSGAFRNLPARPSVGAYSIPSRSCPFGLGIGPDDDLICIYEVSIQRDCDLSSP